MEIQNPQKEPANIETKSHQNRLTPEDARPSFHRPGGHPLAILRRIRGHHDRLDRLAPNP
jgi:hypothetical protein